MRPLSAVVLVGLLAALPLWSQAPSTASDASPEVGAKRLFDFTFGPQEDGNFGVTLKGGKYYALSNITPDSSAASRSLLLSPFVGVFMDAGWSSKVDATNNASLSLRPSLGISSLSFSPDGPPKFRGPWLHAYVDLRERFGKYKQQDGTLLQINQTMAGAGAEFRVVWFDDWLGLSKRTGKIDEAPRLSLTYYTVKGTSVDTAALPDNIEADVVQLDFKMSFTIPRLQCTEIAVAPSDENDPFGGGTAVSCPWSLTLELLGTKPTTGQVRENEWLADAALVYDTGTNLKPALHYRSGKEHGLEYDRQLILGIVMEIF